MTRISLLIAASVLLLPAPASAVTAKLKLVDRTPIVVQATGFRPSERVTVTAYMRSGPLARHVVATRAGSFVVRFAGTSMESCASAISLIRAVGAKGSVAALKFTLRECPEYVP